MTGPRCVRSPRLLASLSAILGALSASGLLSPAQADEPTSQPAGYSATACLGFDAYLNAPDPMPLSNFEQLMTSQALFIQSDIVLAEVVVDPEILATNWYRNVKAQPDSNLITHLRRALNVKRQPETVYMLVTVSTRDKNESKLLANKIAEKYLLKAAQFSRKGYLEKFEALTAEFARLDRQAREKKTLMEKAFEDLISSDYSTIDQTLRFWQEEYLKQQRLVTELEADATSQPVTQSGGSTPSHPDRLALAQKILFQFKDKYEAAVSTKRQCQIKKHKFDELNEMYRLALDLTNEISKGLAKLQIDSANPALKRCELVNPAQE